MEDTGVSFTPETQVPPGGPRGGLPTQTGRKPGGWGPDKNLREQICADTAPAADADVGCSRTQWARDVSGGDCPTHGA